VKLTGKRLVVTGGTGFLGSHVVRELLGAEAQAIGLGSSDYDLRRPDAIGRMLDLYKPHAVVHLAAVVGGIGANRREPARFFYDNAVMGLHLLEECRLRDVQKVLVVGTACSYPSATPLPMVEDDMWSGYPEVTNAPYGIAKRMLLVQAQAYRAQYGTNIVCIVPTNLYGPGDNFDLESGHVIPGMIRRFSEAVAAGADEVTLWGDGTPTREFLFVADAARACRLALTDYDEGDPINVGSGQEISIADLAGVIAEAVGFAGAIKWDSTQPNGQQKRRLATDRARRAFGFTAETGLEEGLTETIDWYRSKTELGVPATPW
jgi:GDP-L-fucose synthase